MPRKFQRRWPIEHRLKANDLSLNITFACDLSCSGCSRACFLKPPVVPPMTAEQVARVYEEAKESGIRIKKTRIVGGEPTLHPDFFQIVAIASANSRVVKVSSNQHSRMAREKVGQLRGKHHNLRVVGRAVKDEDRIFPELSRYIFHDPTDAGIVCPHPCRFMGGRVCGYGVDSLGYSLCPSAGVIDSLLNLNARAKRLEQLKDLEFVTWQAGQICSHCGAYLRAKHDQVWDHNGTSMSLSFHNAVKTP